MPLAAIIVLVICLCLWAFGYLQIMGLACAFASPTGASCRVKMPWELGQEDTLFLVILPGVLTALAVGLTWGLVRLVRTYRRRRQDRSRAPAPSPTASDAH